MAGPQAWPSSDSIVPDRKRFELAAQNGSFRRRSAHLKRLQRFVLTH